MFTLLLPIAGIFLFFLFSQKDSCWRSALLSAAIAWGILLTAITELLSALHFVTLPGLTLSWLVVNLGLGGLLVHKRLQPNRFTPNTRRITSDAGDITQFQWLLLSGVCLIVLLVGITALIAPPNNWDSMTYHMARVAHWVQNRSVAHYPTSFTAQLYQGPWAELAILNLQVLSRGDRFANLVQWFSMIGSVIGVSLIAKQLGASLRGQIFAAVLCTTIPMGMLQASSTQNDYVVSFWMIGLIHAIWLSLEQPENQAYRLKIGGSLGLAILTKGTAYIYSFPYLLWLSLVLIQRLRWKAWKSFLTLGIVAVLINLGHYFRNFDLFGNPIGLPTRANNVVKETNDIFNIPALFSNVLRNLSFHASGPFGLFSQQVEFLIRQVHQFLGIDVNDPHTTWAGNEFSLNSLPNFEDTAPNPWHFFLILIVIGLFLGFPSLRKQRNLLIYLFLLIASFLLFCCLLKWKPWNVRLHLFFFILFMPFVGAVLARIGNQKAIEYMVLGFLTLSLPLVLYNESRPMLGERTLFNTSRVDQYFNLRSTLEVPYQQAVKQTDQCASIGLFLREDGWEYPLWVLLQMQNPAVQIQHINVENISAQKGKFPPFDRFTPCAVIAVGKKTGDRISVNQHPYFKQWQGNDFQESIAVFLGDRR
jgi:hypothetical protein